MTETQNSHLSASNTDLGNLLLSLWGFAEAKVLQVCVKQGFFNFLVCQDEGTDLHAIATEMGWNENATKRVTNLLHNLGLVRISSSQIYITNAASKWLTSQGHQNLIGYFERLSMLEASYARLEYSLQTGSADPEMNQLTLMAFGVDKDSTCKFLQVMTAIGSEFEEELLKVLNDYKNTERRLSVLDVGCGSGTLLKRISRSYQDSYATGFDLPGVLSADMETYTASGNGRLKFVSSSWQDWDWSTAFDWVILSQVLHEFPEDSASVLIARACGCLRHGGLLTVVIVGNGTLENGDLLHSVFGLNILIEVGGFNPSVSWLILECAKYDVELVSSGQLPAGRSYFVARKVGHG